MEMMVHPKKNSTNQDALQEKGSTVFEHSLTEEQQFLQKIMSGEIKTYSHEEVIADLRKVLKR